MIRENISKAINTINHLLGRVSKNSTAQTTKSNYSPYVSLFDRYDDQVSYTVGRQILRDTQVGTGFDILKYLLSSKNWILTNVDEDDTEVYDFINDMIQNMDTKLNVIVKQMTSAIMWGYNVHEIIYDLDDEGRIIVKKLVPLHIKTLQNKPFKYDEDGS